MIINIRGTSGAGKTHLVRRLMAAAGPGEPVLGGHPVKNSTIVTGHRHGGVFFVGSYAATCGGCDKFGWKGAADWVQELIAREAKDNHVVFEGLLVGQWKSERFLQLGRVSEINVVLLTTTLDQCLRAVKARREARGVTDDLNPKNTADKWDYAFRKMNADRAVGIPVHELSRDDAYTFCAEKLGLGAA